MQLGFSVMALWRSWRYCGVGLVAGWAGAIGGLLWWNWWGCWMFCYMRSASAVQTWLEGVLDLVKVSVGVDGRWRSGWVALGVLGRKLAVHARLLCFELSSGESVQVECWLGWGSGMAR